MLSVLLQLFILSVSLYFTSYSVIITFLWFGMIYFITSLAKEVIMVMFWVGFLVGGLSQPRLNIFTMGNMRVMICLGQGGLHSLSACSKGGYVFGSVG